ncbi:MAG: hypothetical protein HC782_05075 [Gammaproteobacteria bacterium]|nr:hypothetical protein [Gammaproteobacteria bacterium]
MATIFFRGILYGMLTASSFIHAFFRRLHWQQVILLVGLTTLAALILVPYFSGGRGCEAKLAATAVELKEMICPGYGERLLRLWHRLFIVALVMFVSFLAADVWWRRAADGVSSPKLNLLPTQLIAVCVGAFVGTVISGLIIGRTLVEMFATDRMLFGILLFTAVGIGIGAVTATLLVYRGRAHGGCGYRKS